MGGYFENFKPDVIVVFLCEKNSGQKYEPPVTFFFTYQKHEFWFENIKNTIVSQKTSKIFYELVLRSYELFVFRKFKAVNIVIV